MMKKNVILILFLLFSCALSAQKKYSYVIIPLQFSEFGAGLNPYNVCSAAMKALEDKSIKSVFITAKVPEDYCEALTLKLEKTSSMLKNKLKVEFYDCTNRLVWSGEGTGRSKDYRKGYNEAIVDAIKDLDGLPVMEEQVTAVFVGTSGNEIEKEGAKNEVPSEIAPKRDDHNNSLAGVFADNRFSVNLSEKENGQKELVIINDSQEEYTNSQVLAQLVPTGIENVFTVVWHNKDGSKQNGVANFSPGQLKISLSGDVLKVIDFKKVAAK